VLDSADFSATLRRGPGGRVKSQLYSRAPDPLFSGTFPRVCPQASRTGSGLWRHTFYPSGINAAAVDDLPQVHSFCLLISMHKCKNKPRRNGHTAQGFPIRDHSFFWYS